MSKRKEVARKEEKYFLRRKKEESLPDFVFRSLEALKIQLSLEADRDAALLVLQHLVEMYQQNPQQKLFEVILGLIQVFEFSSEDEEVVNALRDGAAEGFMELMNLPTQAIEIDDESEILKMIEELSKQFWLVIERNDSLLKDYLVFMQKILCDRSLRELNIPIKKVIQAKMRGAGEAKAASKFTRVG